MGYVKEYFRNDNGVLYQGDCIDVMESLSMFGDKFDMILTDPPYGTTACKWDSVIPFAPMWLAIKGIIKDNGAIVLFGSEPFSSYLRMSNIKKYKYDWVWEKSRGANFAISGKQPLRKTENMSVFYNKQPHYDSLGEKLEKPYTYALPIHKSDSAPVGGRNLHPDGSRIYVTRAHKTKSNLLRFGKLAGDRNLHPTQKPVMLFEYLIKTYTNEGDTVLDFCAGSGTTAVACENLNRRWVCVEQEEKYCEIIKERLCKN